MIVYFVVLVGYNCWL